MSIISIDYRVNNTRVKITRRVIVMKLWESTITIKPQFIDISIEYLKKTSLLFIVYMEKSRIRNVWRGDNVIE